MNSTPEVIDGVEQTVPETVVETPVIIEEKIYEYQPTDEDGRPIGGKQVLKYRTEAELRHLLTQQSILQIRKMRQQERQIRLGITQTDVVDENALRNAAPLEFKKRTLTGEERIKLAQDILDPETFDSAVATVFEATSGITAEKLTSTLTDLQEKTARINDLREVDKFTRNNPDYIICNENAQALVGWMSRYDLAPVSDNFQKAYDTLKAAGVLVTSQEVIQQPIYEEPLALSEYPPESSALNTPVREEIPIENQVPLEAVIVPAVVETPPPPPSPVSRVPTGLNRSNSSSAGTTQPVGDEIVYEFIQRDAAGRQVGQTKVFKGQAALNAMPSDEYKRRLLTEKGFAAKAEKVEIETAKKRRG